MATAFQRVTLEPLPLQLPKALSQLSSSFPIPGGVRRVGNSEAESECHGLNQLILNLEQWQGPRQFRIGLFACWMALNCGSFLTWLGQSIWKFKPEIIHYHRVSIRGLKSKLSWITLSSPRFTKDEKDWVLLGLENEQMPKWLMQRAFQN